MHYWNKRTAIVAQIKFLNPKIEQIAVVPSGASAWNCKASQRKRRLIWWTFTTASWVKSNLLEAVSWSIRTTHKERYRPIYLYSGEGTQWLSRRKKNRKSVSWTNLSLCLSEATPAILRNDFNWMLIREWTRCELKRCLDQTSRLNLRRLKCWKVARNDFKPHLKRDKSLW